MVPTETHSFRQHAHSRSRDGKPPRQDFNEDEFNHRISRVRKTLAKHNLDGLLLTSPENIYYFTGYQNAVLELATDQVCALLLDSGGNAGLVGMEWTQEIVDQTSWIGVRECITGLHPTTSEVARAVNNTIENMGMKGAAVGVEYGEKLSVRLPTEIFVSLLKERKANFVDGSAAIWETRTIKSEFEIKRIQKSAQIAGLALYRALGSFHPGMSEVDLAQLLSRFMIEEGANRPASTVLNSGPRKGPRVAGAYPSKRKIRHGDYVQIDFGAYYDHYLSDLCRMAYVGTPAKEDRDLWALYVEANKKGTNAIRPNVRASHVCKVMTNVFEEAGLKYVYDSTGHGIGLSAHEPPTLSTQDHTLLEPGMVFSVEPDCVANKAGVYFNCEDNVLCTTASAKRLSTLGWEIIEI